jgi:competence protein ComEA
VFLLGAATALLAGHALKSLRWGTRPTELEPGPGLSYRIDLNRASRAELLQLPGVGEKLVGRILDYRRTHGPFRQVEDLRKVHGVGPATLDRLRPWVCVDPDDGDEEPEPAAQPTPPRRQPQKPPPAPAGAAKKQKGVSKKEANLQGKRINVNRASAAELQLLPWVGKATAERIIEERQKAPFKSVEDLRRVSGIGLQKIKVLRPYVALQGEAVQVVK